MIYDNNGSVNSCFFRSTTNKPYLKILLQITERCNLKCKHCFVSSLPEGNDLPFQTIKDIILPRLKAANVSRITLTGGEPMVHKNILEIIEEINKYKMHITLCTNGLGLNETFIRKLYNLGDIHVNVSLDGFSSSSHGKFRGNENESVFEKIIANIKLLSKYKLLNGILCSPNKYASMDEYVELAKFAKSIGAKYLLLNPLSKFGRGENSQDIGYNQQNLILLRQKIEALNLNNENFQIVYIRIPLASKKQTLTNCNCEIPYIFTNGDVAVCPYLVFATQNKGCRYSRKDFLYGNILNTEFDLNSAIKKYKFPIEPNTTTITCKSCGKGCKAIKVANNLSINDCDTELCYKNNMSSNRELYEI